jgi:hypothetical protein
MQKQISSKIIALTFGVLVICFAIAFYVVGWTEPSQAPPNGNVATPINTGSTAQTKAGTLSISAGGGDAFIIQNGGDLKIYTPGNIGSSSLYVDNNGEIITPGDFVAGNVRASAFYYLSDISLKENIQPLTDSLDKILNLSGVEFNFKDDAAKKKTIGLIAQDVEKILPEIVVKSETTGLESVDYAKLVPVLIEALKEQQKEIDNLKSQMESLKESK